MDNGQTKYDELLQRYRELKMVCDIWVAANDAKDQHIAELEEELGREAEWKFLPGFREETVYEVDEGEGPRKKRVTYFLARLEGGRIVRSPEHDAQVWAGLDTALAVLQHEDLREILRKAHRFLEEQG